MSSSVFFIVLFAAALHAMWNAIVKGAGVKLLITILIAGTAGLLSAVVLPFLPQPAEASWPFIGASVILQIIYFALLARTYHLTDMSLTYPLMRGTAPLLVALAGFLALGENLPGEAWAGIGILCAGILGMAAGRWERDWTGIFLALLNAAVIAGYTLVDGAGVRRSGAPAAYTLWIFLLSGAALALWGLIARGGELRACVSRYWHLGLVGGCGSALSYGLALWAMTQAPIAVVAALRETSILFATLIAIAVLGERVERRRMAAVFGIALGAMLLRLA